MMKLITWTKTSFVNNKFTKIIKKNFVLIILPLMLLILIAYLSVFIFKVYKQTNNQVFTPVETIEVNEPFSGNFHFNDILGKDDFSNLIVDNINKSTKTVELAMYSMDNTDIRDALFAAAGRGVKISLLFSRKHAAGETKFLANKPSNITLTFVGSASSDYMHHKFLLIDRGEVNQKLFFGSYNYTYIQGKFDPSFIMETSRPELVRIFGTEFDRLLSNDKWLAKKNASYNPFAALVKYSDGYLEIWFTPEPGNNNIKNRMIGLIEGATSNIKIMAWYITDKDIASILAVKAKTTPVSIITDDSNWSAVGSAFPILSAQKERQKLDNLEIITDSKRNLEVSKILRKSDLNSFLHHHLLIIDDKIALFGTNNWSFSGFFVNDESVMVSNIGSIVSSFKKSFLYNYNNDK
jgi:phosphatidylserine/phosphatidylglycerophosphate/cardiolipin synthase-like enzyme